MLAKEMQLGRGFGEGGRAEVGRRKRGGSVVHVPSTSSSSGRCPSSARHGLARWPCQAAVPAALPRPADEVLDLMCSMLGFSPTDRQKIAESRRRQGWRDISLASDAQLPPGSAAAAKQSLADSWVDFLQQQIEADAAAAGTAAPSPAAGATALRATPAAPGSGSGSYAELSRAGFANGHGGAGPSLAAPPLHSAAPIL